MAKKRKKKPAQHAPAPPPEPPKPVEVPVREPAFWFGFEVSWTKLWLTRVVVFGLLALDAVLQVQHAPRYGAGGFNIGQLPGFDGLAPGRAAYEVTQLVLAYLFVMAACGVLTRVIVPLAALLDAWLYFGSQLDSYQHHYLVVMVLAIASFVPWQRPEQPTVRSWALRLLLVQLAIMYLWAAISKLDTLWINGATLGKLTGPLHGFIARTVGMKVASVLVILTELTLAATVWNRRTWKIAAPLGILLHLGIAASKLDIGLFAYIMLGLYILVVPDRVWSAIAPIRMRPIAASTGWIMWGAGIALAFGIALLARFENGLVAAVLVAIAGIAIGIARRPRVAMVGIAQLLAALLWWTVDRAADVSSDYYRYWGASQRRLGDLAQAERAYRTWLDKEPDAPTAHYQLGRTLLATNRAEEGIAELHRAQQLEPRRARAWLEEARWLAVTGRTAEAIAKAREAAFAEPSSAEARALLGSLTGGRPASPNTRDDDSEAP